MPLPTQSVGGAVPSSPYDIMCFWNWNLAQRDYVFTRHRFVRDTSRLVPYGSGRDLTVRALCHNGVPLNVQLDPIASRLHAIWEFGREGVYGRCWQGVLFIRGDYLA